MLFSHVSWLNSTWLKATKVTVIVIIKIQLSYQVYECYFSVFSSVYHQDKM